ncbi:MAG: mercuric reductase [Acidobacteriia bacterium]|nr:mercuric reductase [Terriglobia bacterium]
MSPSLDEFDRALLDQVHPGDWTNPEPLDRYHLVVVGAGTGGLVSAAGAAALGAKVALVERHLMGGDCLNVGCVPSKALLGAARAWRGAGHAASGYGGPPVAGPGDFEAAMRRMRRLRASLAPHDGARRFAELGVHVFLGQGTFVAPDALEVDGRTLRFRRAVIATGARAAVPPIPGLAEAGYLTNETIFSLTELPESLAVIGAGPVGCEMAQAFARFGSRVSLFDGRDRILPRDDPDAADVVRLALARDGVDLHLGTRILQMEREDGRTRVRYEREGRELSVTASHLLVAAGRAPNVEGLGLEAAGVAFDRSGVAIDDRMRTSNRRIYAVGDVAPLHKFTHAADAHARIVLANALFFGRSRVSRLVVPWCTYTSPELAHAGMSLAEAERTGSEVETITVPMSDVDRAVLDGEDEGFLRVHFAKGSGRILGATLVAENAGDLIGELTLAITTGASLGAIGRTIHPYPTRSEVIRKAADAWRRTKLTPRTRRVLSLVLRLLR